MRNIGKILFLISVQLVFANCYAQSIGVNALRYVTAANQAQLQFDVTARANYHLFLLNNPFRLVIDIKNAQLGTSALTQPPSDHPLFADVRYAGRNGGMRVVFDLKNHLDINSFSVTANNDDEHSLVVDLLTQDVIAPTTPVLPSSQVKTNPPLVPNDNSTTNKTNEKPETKETVTPNSFETPSVATDVNALRYITTANQTQLQFDVTTRPKYSLFLLNKPFRLVIDIENARLGSSALSQPPSDHPLFSDVSSSEKNGGIRVVFGVKSSLDLQSFSVTSNSDDAHSLVVSLLPQIAVAQDAPVLPSSPPPPVSPAATQKIDDSNTVDNLSPVVPNDDSKVIASETTPIANESPIPDEDKETDEADEELETKTTDKETATPKLVEKTTPANDNIVEGKALLEIIINGENLGAQLVNLKKDDVLVSTAVFKDWRIKKDLWSSQTDNVSLRSLAPNLQYTVDNNNAALTIALTPDSFEPQVLETQSQYNPVVPADAVRPTPWSGFINYALNANFSQPKGFDSLNAPWEVGITAGRWFAFSSFNSNYINLDQSFKTTRSTSYLQWEDMENHQKVTLGDFSVNTPTLSSSGNFGGILWQSNFRQYGQFQSMPSLGLDFNVETPSHAELYVNDVKTKEWDLLPGNVSLPSVLTSGQGNATLVLTDAFGRQQQISQPFYITQQLLKEGLHEFYYGLGARHKFSNKMIDYGNSVLFGAHRYGFSDTLTAGAAFTATKKVSNVGVSVTQSFLGNSLIDTAVAMSHQGGGLNGYLGVASYQLNLQPINLSLNAGYMSQQFGNLNIDAASLQKNKYRLQASLNYNIPYTGSSVGASVSQSASWGNSPISKSLALFFRQSILSSLNINIQVNHDLATGDNIISAMLNYFPRMQDTSDILNNNNFSYQANYNDKTHVDTQVWQTQKQGSIGEGYNYTASLQKQDQKLSGIARYQYQNNNGIYTANYAQNEQTIRGNVSVAGSLVTANNEVYFGRPITDSFAVVKVNGAEEDIPIYSNGARLGWGNNDKVVIIPNLQSRRVGKMSIKPEDIGLAVEADHPEQAVDVGVRTASVVEFTLSQFVAAEGNAYILNKDGSKQYLEALPLEYTAKGKAQDSFIAKKGFFYLENVPTGEFKATVKRYKHDCILHLTIPKSDKVVVKLGDVLCE